MSRLLKEPLLHFLLLGGLIFFAYGKIAGPQRDRDDVIVVSLAHQQNLANTFERTWQRPPTQAELEGMIADYIRQEIAYRESQSMQLDRDDIVIRRRLRQKLEMLTEDMATLTPPTDADLQQFLDANPARFRIPGVATFRHVYFDTNADATRARQRAEALLAGLRHGAALDPEAAGDRSLLPSYLEDVRETEVRSMFGDGFAADVWSLEPGSWQGPVSSAFGLHLVRVEARTDGRIPELDEVANRVAREWLSVRRGEVVDRLYERLSENYTITIEAPAEILSPESRESGGAR